MVEKTKTKKKKENKRHRRTEKETETEMEKETETETERFSMAAAGERSREGFHYSPLPVFKWGRQKTLRFGYGTADDRITVRSPPLSVSRRGGQSMAVRRSEAEKRRRCLFGGNETMTTSSWIAAAAASEIGSRKRKERSFEEEEDGIEAVRTKLMLDFQTEVDRMKVAILREGNDEIEPSKPAATEAAEIRPWNLRTRRAARKNNNAGDSIGVGGGKSPWIDDRKPNGNSPVKNESKVPRLRSAVGTGEEAGEARAKFAVSLSKEEIVEDFFTLTGSKPNRRPKKRPRSVQKQLDSLFPGLWLSEISPEMYNVSKNFEPAKVTA